MFTHHVLANTQAIRLDRTATSGPTASSSPFSPVYAGGTPRGARMR